MNGTYLLVGEHDHWLVNDFNEIDPYNGKGDYVIDRARLYKDRRDFMIQPGDTGRSEYYPVNSP